MSRPAETIHTAYAVSRRGGTTYRARAVVKTDGFKGHHTQTVCLDDTAEAAVAGAVQYVREIYRRERLPEPQTVTHHGRLHSAVVDNLLFAKDAAA